MLDRASAVDANFIRCVMEGRFPNPYSSTSLQDSQISESIAMDCFDSQIKSRLLDIIARQLKEKGLSFYTIGSSGHEGNAVIGDVFRLTDMAFLHYRSGGFFLQRAKKHPDVDGVHDILRSLVAASSDPISGGRHKVFGSVPLCIPPQTSTIASHLPKALGVAFSINRAKALKLSTPIPHDAVILCSFGDASFNHASSQTTLNACEWMHSQGYPLPIVFICEDNGIGISVSTPKGYIASRMNAFQHITYIACDGLNIFDVYEKAKLAEKVARIEKKPVFLHMHCVRLMGHAGSDIEIQYKTQTAIEKNEADDPLLHSARLLIQEKLLTPDDIIDLYKTNRTLIEAKSLSVIELPKLASKDAIMSSILPLPYKTATKPLPCAKEREAYFGIQYTLLHQPRHLCQMINMALTDLMIQYPEMVLFGEDVGKKGGVYRVTADLQARFGAVRVFDSLLDETTILGTAIGLAHNGFIPVPEIQFLAYLHNAEDQLRGEAATLSFFSSGQYKNPMLIRIASLGYQKGFGGHFHNDNSIAVLRDLPGVIVACPSNGLDAVKMLRRAMQLVYEEGRIVVFLEPIALYMTKDLHEVGDNGWLCQYPALSESIALGEVGVYGDGDVVILTYGNGYYLSRIAVNILERKHKIKVKVVDLRWLVPLPVEAILQAVNRANYVLIVDEGRRSGSISEAIMTLLVENTAMSFKLARITGEDCFIPLGNAWSYVLPSVEGIVNQVRQLCQKQKEKQRVRFITS
jgi:2-oxoisovalerate dehydrogenase E1 component